MFALSQPYTIKERRALWRASALGLCMVIGLIANLLHSFEAHVYCPVHGVTEHVAASGEHQEHAHPNPLDTEVSDTPQIEGSADSEVTVDHDSCFQECGPQKRAYMSAAQETSTYGSHRVNRSVTFSFVRLALWRLAPKGSPPEFV